ncbi:hypothetical protein E0H39_32810 [Rhizobium leguminosarum bv. viciae]|nr:hypothetical protein CHR56_08220 [Rhizobium leguminosarum bv. viciae]OOO52414.1 hypothetical protein BS629_10135 [Rhizobium leguminosarum bv. viciae USDA 2370]RWX41350.1 hypothetical protein EHH54_07500 [Rhizobium leguminosarum]NKJ79604.1 hypothetical protein [Rhizobium leguminosarum bv. viciae]NKK15940.1 hypothetical protein [Rhizobium leguminosarum bv. viciae]
MLNLSFNRNRFKDKLCGRPQGFFQFCRRLSQNLKKAGLCPDISIRASGESSATDLSANLYG